MTEMTKQLQLEPLHEAIAFGALPDEHLLAYAIQELRANVLMMWGDHVVEQLTQQSPPPLYRVLYDLSHPSVSMSYLVLTGRNMFNIGITPRGRFLINNFLDKHPTLQISIALVLSSETSGRIAARYQVKPFHDQIVGKMFFEREDALHWLRNQKPVAEMQHHTQEVMSMTSLANSEQRISAGSLLNQDSDLTDMSIHLYIGGTVERLDPQSQPYIILGRNAERDGDGFLDLSPYGTPALSVSRQHAKLERNGLAVYITDLNSSNGTYVNGKRLDAGEPHRLQSGANVQIGKLRMRVQI